jgi:NAD(P)-dependent dehydrogenase (short-subunit alcohol dehydrogenase family)
MIGRIMKNIVVIGSAGALGRAFVNQLAEKYPKATIHAFSRTKTGSFPSNVFSRTIDYQDEDAIEKAASIASQDTALDMVIVATGLLHDGEIKPEKSLHDLAKHKFLYLFEVNSILPALCAKYFLPKLRQNERSIFAVLSARVGSISDNRLGGWYAYRASKAALNMIIKNAAIEMQRLNKQAIIVALHPGTVDSSLSKPYQANVPEDKLFSPDDACQKLLTVLENLGPQQSGKLFAWDGEEIAP